jgi:hypothetical protein
LRGGAIFVSSVAPADAHRRTSSAKMYAPSQQERAMLEDLEYLQAGRIDLE